MAAVDKLDAKKRKFLESLETHKGIVTYAAEEANIGRSTHYHWYSTDEAYKKAVDEINNTAIDYVENKLFERIEAGDTTAAIFFLKTRGKSRGYVEKQQIEHSHGNIQFIIQPEGEEPEIDG